MSDLNMQAEKQYIGREEAYELLLERFYMSFERLPRKGREYITSSAIVEKTLYGKVDIALGHDERGYYIREIK